MGTGKKALIALVVLLPAIAYVGVKLFIHRNAEAALKQLAAVAAPYAAIRYGDISTSMNGSVHVTNVEIQPRGMNVALPVKTLDIETPGLMYLLGHGGGDFWIGARAETLRIVATGLALDLGGEAGALLDQLAQLTARPDAIGLPQCGNQTQVGLRLWRDMGYNRLHLDATFDYAAERSKDTARLAINAIIKDVVTIEAQAALSQIEAQSKSSSWLRGHLSEVRVVYKDQGYLDGLKRHCATASGIGVPEFIEAEAGEGGSIFLRQWGIVPSAALRTAYRDFLAKPESLALNIAVPPDFKLQNTDMYNSIDMADMLSFSVSLNGKRADETQYSFRPAHDGPSQAMLSARAAVDAMNKPVVRASKATNAGIVDPPKIVFRDVPKEQLQRHIGKQVRFHVSGSSVREGTLIGIEGGLAHVQRNRGDNEMTLTIALRHVDRVEVQR